MQRIRREGDTSRKSVLFCEVPRILAGVEQLVRTGDLYSDCVQAESSGRVISDGYEPPYLHFGMSQDSRALLA